jgi:hypothetical protein
MQGDAGAQLLDDAFSVRSLLESQPIFALARK